MISNFVRQRQNFDTLEQEKRSKFESKMEASLKAYAVTVLRTEAWDTKVEGMKGFQRISAYVVGFFQEVLRFISFGNYPGRVAKIDSEEINQKVVAFKTEIQNKIEAAARAAAAEEDGGAGAAGAAGGTGGAGDNDSDNE